MDTKVIIGVVAGTAAAIGLGFIIHNVVVNNNTINEEEVVNCNDGVELVKAIKKLAAQAKIELTDDKLILLVAGLLIAPVEKLTFKQLRDALNHCCANDPNFKGIKF